MTDYLFLLFIALFAGGCVGNERLSRADKEGGKGNSITGVLWFFLLPLSIPRLPFWFALASGVIFALGYAGWMLGKLRLALPISLMLACSQTLVWTLFAIGTWKLWNFPFPLDCVLIASWGTALFWLEWTLLPLWGTAQNFTCSSPINHPFIAFFGASGGTWSSIFVSALFGVVISSIDEGLLRGHPAPLFMSVALILGSVIFVSALDSLFLKQKNPQTLRVATFGWSGPQFDALTEIPAEYQNVARQASEQGARLLVTPEAAIRVGDRVHFRVAMCSLAQRYNIALAIGYFDQGENRNCIDFVSAQGEVVGRYVKTHLVPIFERYTRGTGEIALMEVDGIKVGGIICQDDNFPDIARKYARAGTQLLVVPTNDWKKVKDIHLSNHLWRALEFRFALARAASDGISALTSAGGTIETSIDHFQDGPKLLVTDLKVGSGKPTLYARTGDWFPIACGIAAVGALVWTR